MREEQILKYIAGLAAGKEAEEINLWIEKSESNKIQFSKLKNLWVLSSLNDIPKGVDVSAEIEKIIRLKKWEEKGTRPIINIPWSKIAAVAIILIVTSIGGYFVGNRIVSNGNQNFVVETPNGERSKAILPDGSIVWINSGSKIEYQSNFNNSNRTILLEGEAYFEVAKNLMLKFVVKTKHIEVTALGTAFNVMAYENEPVVQTTLVEGKVNVKAVNSGCNFNLMPGYKLELNKELNTALKAHVNTQLLISWKEGIFVFKDATLMELARKLERMYDVTIVIVDQELKANRYTGDFRKGQSIKQILDIINIPTNYRYEINGNNIIIRK